MQTPVPGLYAIGDGAGVTRGLVQASASGLVAARAVTAAGVNCPAAQLGSVSWREGARCRCEATHWEGLVPVLMRSGRPMG